MRVEEDLVECNDKLKEAINNSRNARSWDKIISIGMTILSLGLTLSSGILVVLQVSTNVVGINALVCGFCIGTLSTVKDVYGFDIIFLKHQNQEDRYRELINDYEIYLSKIETEPVGEYEKLKLKLVNLNNKHIQTVSCPKCCCCFERLGN